jgi:hypothetical protein
MKAPSIGWFDAWAIFWSKETPTVTETVRFSGNGPSINAWMIEQRKNGATRVGYQRSTWIERQGRVNY